MQASDVALLGFVSAAQRYVDKHIEDGSNLGDLNKIDISKLKKELSEQLKFLALSDTYKKELIETGAKAFDEYAKDKLGNKKNILFELGEVFTPDVKKPQDKNVNMPKINTKYVDSKDNYGVNNNDNILLAIASAASKSDEQLKEEYEVKAPSVNIAKPANMDEIYSSVMANEEIAKAQAQPKINVKVKLENNKPKVNLEAKNNKKVSSANVPLSERLKNIAKNDLEKGTNVKEEVKKEEPTYQTIITNPGLDVGGAVVSETFHKVDNSEVLSDNSINNILDGLENLQKRQEERKKAKEPKSDIDLDVYKNIVEAYPYLSRDFIVDLYEQRFEIDRDYELDKEYIILHRIKFDDLDKLRQFVEIMVNHEYSVNVDESKMIVDSFKSLINEHGAILTNVYTLANQAAIIGGAYEGYQVIDIE